MLNRQRENLHGVVYHQISQINILDSSDWPYLYILTSSRMILIMSRHSTRQLFGGVQTTWLDCEFHDYTL